MDKSLDNYNFSLLQGKQVFLEPKYLKAVDQEYVLLALKHRMMIQGAVILDKADKADVIVEVASGAVGTDVQELFVGVPEIPLPPPSPVAIPRLAFFTRNRLNGTAKLLVVAYDARTKLPIFPTGMALARSDQKNISILGAGPMQYGSVPKEIAAATKDKDVDLTTAGNYVSAPINRRRDCSTTWRRRRTIRTASSRPASPRRRRIETSACGLA